MLTGGTAPDCIFISIGFFLSFSLFHMNGAVTYCVAE